MNRERLAVDKKILFKMVLNPETFSAATYYYDECLFTSGISSECSKESATIQTKNYCVQYKFSTEVEKLLCLALAMKFSRTTLSRSQTSTGR